MRIYDNQFKLGQKVLARNYDNERELFPMWVVGIDLKSARYMGFEIVYTLAENSQGKCLSDGWPEDKLVDPDSLGLGVEDVYKWI